MAASRDQVLIQITTAANMAGIKQAQAGMLGLNVATVALAVTLGTLIFVGKEAVQNYRAQQDALSDLEQAFQSQGDLLDFHRKAIDDWIETNRRFISNQYEARSAMAEVIRSGAGEAAAIAAMNTALDLAAAKHITLKEATEQVILAQQGNKRSLKILGIDLGRFDDIMKSDTLPLARKHALVLDLINEKVKLSKEKTDEVTQSQNNLNMSWQDFTAKRGPTVVKWWGKITDAIATGVEILDLYLQLVERVNDLTWGSLGQKATAGGSGFAGGLHNRKRALGGPVGAGGAYTVGEQGPETLVMGSADGTIIPNGAGRGETHIHVHVDRGAFIDGPGIDRLVNTILQRARFAPGR